MNPSCCNEVVLVSCNQAVGQDSFSPRPQKNTEIIYSASFDLLLDKFTMTQALNPR